MLSAMRATTVQPDEAAEFMGAEQRMLMMMRDTLYEGDWDDFVADLTARLEGRAHVFQTVGTSPDMKATITRHLQIIAELRRGTG